MVLSNQIRKVVVNCFLSTNDWLLRLFLSLRSWMSDSFTVFLLNNSSSSEQSKTNRQLTDSCYFWLLWVSQAAALRPTVRAARHAAVTLHDLNVQFHHHWGTNPVQTHIGRNFTCFHETYFMHKCKKLNKTHFLKRCKSSPVIFSSSAWKTYSLFILIKCQ